MFDYVPDERIAILCGVYFVLSIIMTIIINRLPVFSWTWTSVFGIACVVLGVYFFAWLPRGELLDPTTAVIDLYLVFASSLSPLSVGEYRQYRQYKEQQQAQDANERACMLGMMTGILAKLDSTKLDSIFTYLTEQPVEDVTRN